MLLESGLEGVPKDEKKAYEFTKKAASRGSAKAKCNLGVYYINGIGVSKDEDKAVKLICESADAGYNHGMYLTGLLYKQGKHVKKDLTEALKWYERAAAKGSQKAMFELAYAYGLGKNGEYEIDRDFPKAIENLKKAADLKLPCAQRVYGIFLIWHDFMGMMAGDDGTPDDTKKGVTYILDAAEQGDGEAMFVAGKIYWEGAPACGVEKDKNKAVELWRKARNTNEDAKAYLEAIEKKRIAYPLNHNDLTPVENVDSFCSIPLRSSALGKTGNWRYKFKDNGEELVEWFELPKPFRIYTRANIYYTPLTKTLSRIDLVHMFLEGDSWDNLVGDSPHPPKTFFRFLKFG